MSVSATAGCETLCDRAGSASWPATDDVLGSASESESTISAEMSGARPLLGSVNETLVSGRGSESCSRPVPRKPPRCQQVASTRIRNRVQDVRRSTCRLERRADFGVPGVS